MSELTMKKVFIVVLIFGGLITGMSGFITEVGGNYNKTTTGLPAFDKSGAVNSTISSFSDMITSGNIFLQIAAFFLMPVTMITLMMSSVGYANDIIASMMSSNLGLPVPSWFLAIVEVGVFAAIVFALWNAITGRRDA